MQDAIDEYREQNNWFNHFIEDCCEVDSKAKVSYYTCSESAVANGGYYNYPNNCGTCGCGSWGSWSDYNLSSCAGSSSVQCESTTIYQ